MALARDVGEGPPGPDAGSGRGLPPLSKAAVRGATWQLGEPPVHGWTFSPSDLSSSSWPLVPLSVCPPVSVCLSLAVSVYLLSL